MKFVKTVLLLVAVFFSMAYTTGDTLVLTGIRPGESAPEVHLQHLSLKGKYSLLQLWAAYDAASRADNVLLSNKLNQLHREDIQMISISFDEKKSVFEETIKTDRLNPAFQFNIPAGKQSQVFKDYRLSEGFKNILVNPQGVIVAVNVTPDELESVLEKI